MVRPDGFEPPTLCSEDRCSNPLSYGRVITSVPSLVLVVRLFGHVGGFVLGGFADQQASEPDSGGRNHKCT